MHKSASAELRAWRAAEDLTLDQAAKKLKCSSSFLSNLEHGVRSPGVKFALYAQKIVGIDPWRWVTTR